MVVLEAQPIGSPSRRFGKTKGSSSEEQKYTMRFTLTLQSLLFFWQKSEDPPKKARISLPAEPLKSLEKRAKTHEKARKTAKTKKKRGKQKNEDWKVRAKVELIDNICFGVSFWITVTESSAEKFSELQTHPNWHSFV